MFWIRLHREHHRLAALTMQAVRWTAEAAPALSQAAAHVSGWTPAQHLHHVAAINQRILHRLLAGTGGEAGGEAGRPNVAGYLVLTLGRLPRGRARSPEAFEPPATVAAEALAEQVRANRAQLAALKPRLDVLRRRSGRWPHPRLGLLDAGEWLRFARIHTAHHHRIVQDILDIMRET